MENNIINDDKLEIEDYLPTKTQLQLECGTIGVYLNLKLEDNSLYILIYILNFCEDEKDLMEIKRYLKYCSTKFDFAKYFYDKYSCLINARGKEIVDNLFDNSNVNYVIGELKKESVKYKSLKKSK